MVKENICISVVQIEATEYQISVFSCRQLVEQYGHGY